MIGVVGVVVARRAARALCLVTVVSVALAAGAGVAHAKKPEDVFAGRILISDKQFPSSSKSVGAYIGTLKKQSKDKLWENKEKSSWKVFYVAFFRKPLNDLEVTVKLFDVSQPSEQRSSGTGSSTWPATSVRPRARATPPSVSSSVSTPPSSPPYHRHGSRADGGAATCP